MKQVSQVVTRARAQLLKIVGSSIGCVDMKNLEEFGRKAEQLVLQGKLGYGILIGTARKK